MTAKPEAKNNCSSWSSKRNAPTYCTVSVRFGTVCVTPSIVMETVI